MYKNQKLSKIDEEFFDLTKSFDLEDCRPRSTYEKLDLIRHYVNKGFAK